MADERICPRCKAPLPDDAPGGACPACLIGAGLESAPVVATGEFPGTEQGAASARGGAATAPGADWETPTCEELSARLPQLEVLELLGRGGMGAVYKARQIALDRLVAVKVLPQSISRDSAFSERFVREAKALARLQHPNIVAVFDFGRVEDTCYLVMEYVDGVNLRRAILTRSLTAEQALAVVPQICDALQYAHDEGVVHRDIKPENILLDAKGRVKIADFGLAKLLRRSTPELALTATHQIMGTLHYMAPEQLENPLAVDHRADIYSLGVVFYELLTGQLPLGRFALPSEKAAVDARLDDVVLRSLEREPARRYQHASEVKTQVQTIASAPQRIPPRAATNGRPSPLAGRPGGAPAGKTNSVLLAIGGTLLAIAPLGCVMGILLQAGGAASTSLTLLPFAAAVLLVLFGGGVLALAIVSARSLTSAATSASSSAPAAAYVAKPAPPKPPVAMPAMDKPAMDKPAMDKPRESGAEEPGGYALATAGGQRSGGERLVRWPARCLWVAGAASFLTYTIAGLVFIILSFANPDVFARAPYSAFIYAAAAALGLCCSSLILHASSRLRWRSGRPWILAGAVLAMAPQPFAPAWLIGWIGGLWTLLALRRPAVRSDLDREPDVEEGAQMEEGSRRRRMVLVAGVLLLTTAAGLAHFGPQLAPREIGAVLTYEARPTVPDQFAIQEFQRAVVTRVNTSDRPQARVEFLTDKSSSPSKVEVRIEVFGRDAAIANRIEERLAARGEIELLVLAHSQVDSQIVEASQQLPTYEPSQTTAGDESRSSISEPSSAPPKAKWVTVAPRAVSDFLDPFGQVQTHFATRRGGSGELEALVLVDDLAIGRDDIARIERNPFEGLSLEFNSRGAEKMRLLTSQPAYAKRIFDHEIRRLAVIVDGQLFSMLPMGAVITDRMQLTGLTEEESQGLAAILKTGPLPAKLTQIGRKDLP